MAPSGIPHWAARRKCIIVGKGASIVQGLSGRKTLGHTLIYGPSVPADRYWGSYETLVGELELADGKDVRLALWYIWDHEDYGHLRVLSYSRADVVIATFAVDDLESFADVKDRWIPEARSFLPGVPILLVGCKGDLRTSPDSHLGCFVPVTEAERLVATLGLYGYVECTSHEWDSVRTVFKLAATASLAYRMDKSNHTTCTIS